jgi:nicotinate-nucleotide adenylyltransferase
VTRCVALLGGSFDPVHNGHVALASHFAHSLQPDELRIVPALSPWQKGGLVATPEQRCAMLELAFNEAGLPFTLDRQELDRGTPSYTIDTLRALRAELGPDTSIVFLMGADQLQHLDTWRDWRDLFDLTHFGVAARPGFALTDAALPAPVRDELQRRTGSSEQLRATPHGLISLARELAVDISATEIRAALQREQQANSLISPVVLDYIHQHNLYKS